MCLTLLFINGTILEQPCIFQGVVAFITMLYYAYHKNRTQTIITGVFWIVSVLSFLIMFFAPGTALRMASIHGTQSIINRTIQGLIIASTHGLFTIIKFFVKPINYIFLLFLPLAAKVIAPFDKTIKLKVWHIIIITSLVAPAMQFLQSWSMRTGFPDRAVSLTLWSMGFVWCILWTFFYRGSLITSQSFNLWSSKLRWPALIFVLLISSNFIDVVSALSIAPVYRYEQEARMKYMLSQRDAGVEDVIIPKIKNKPAIIYTDTGILASESTAYYYGVKSIMTLPEAMTLDKEAIDMLRGGSYVPLVKYAEEGDVDLQYLLGWHSDPMYNSPYGLNMNIDEAEKWDRMGAENGHLLCMRALSRVIYTKDHSLNGILRAMYWLAKYQLATLRF